MNIYIPSRSRADVVFNLGKTIHGLKGTPVTLVVPWGQLKAYKAAAEEHPTVEVIAKKGVNGIAKTRKFCAENAAQNNQPNFFMLDDDIKFFRRATKGQTNLTEVSTKAQINKMFRGVEKSFKTFGMVGISAREGNGHVPTDTVENTRLMRAWGAQTDLFLSLTHGRVTVMEDFDIMLQALRRGHPNLCFFNYAQNQAGTQQPGGCSDYRTHENHNASAEKLAKLHHPFVKLRQKHNKTGGEFGQRTEVTIYWKKAYASHQGT